MAERTLYEILEVPKTATPDDIKSSFRRLAQKYHPDRNPNDRQAEEKFKEVNAAYEVLHDPKKRAMYDELGPDAIKIGFDEAQAESYRQWKKASSGRGARTSGFSSEFNFDFGAGQGSDFRSIFETLFGGFGGGRKSKDGQSPRGSRRQLVIDGEDQELQISIPFHLAVRGGNHTVRFTRSERCGLCGGSGSAPSGRGTCRACGGSGSKPETTQSLEVRIPAGAAEGTKIRLAGQGMPGMNGGKPGDLYLLLHVEPHPRVRREGKDLYLDLPVTPLEAFRGGEVRCPTFDGNFTLTIPQHSQSGRKLRLKGLGVPDLKGGARGDFYVVLQVVLPERDAPELLEACETLSRAIGTADVRSSVVL